MKNYKITVNGTTYDVNVDDGTPVEISQSQPTQPAQSEAKKSEAKEEPKKEAPAPSSNGDTKIEAPMPGTVLRINKKVGDPIKTGEVILILEAMKMENEITSTTDGTISSINVSEGASVNAGDVLATI